VRKPTSLTTDRFPKTTGIIHFCANGLGRRLAQHFDGFFSSKKGHQPNRKKGFYTGRLPKSEEIRVIFVSSKEIWT
jgi:hypothetical protein